MSGVITTITTRHLMPVNCYLLKVEGGFLLIDTGFATRRRGLERALSAAGCTRGGLRAILLTHGDLDHAGNAAYLRRAYDVPVLMHAADVGMVEKGDMFWNRRPVSRLRRTFIALMKMMVLLSRFEKFAPDTLVDESDSLAGYGCAGKIVHLPGHSAGSIGLLLPDGALIGGDLFNNWGGHAKLHIIDDEAAAATSLAKLQALPVKRVYPGHGAPFEWSAFHPPSVSP